MKVSDARDHRHVVTDLHRNNRKCFVRYRVNSFQARYQPESVGLYGVSLPAQVQKAAPAPPKRSGA